MAIFIVNNGMDIRHSIMLMEASTYSTFFTEGAREDFLLKTYGQKITDHLNTNHVPEVSDAKGLIDLLAASDPSQKKLYTQWLVTRFLSDSLRLEDLPKAERYLSIFDANKRNIVGKDIAAYRTLPDLLRAIEPFVVNNGGEVSQRDEFKEIEQEMLRQAEVVLDDSRYRVLIPFTQEASCYFGHHTEWCTAFGGKWSNYPERSQNKFDDYSADGDLYIILDKSSGERWQLFLGTHVEFKDEKDEEIEEYGRWFFEHPVLAKLFYKRSPMIVLQFDLTIYAETTTFDDDGDYDTESDEISNDENISIQELLQTFFHSGIGDDNGESFASYGNEDYETGATSIEKAFVKLGDNPIRKKGDSLTSKEFDLLKIYILNNYQVSTKYRE